MEIAGTHIPAEIEALLERFHFDRVPFEELRARLIAAAPDLESLHRITRGDRGAGGGRRTAAARAGLGRSGSGPARAARRRSATASSRPSCSRAAWRRASARRSRALAPVLEGARL